MAYCDSTGRRIRYGDLLRMFLYFDTKNWQIVWQYKLVVAVNGEGEIDLEGETLVLVDVADIARVGLKDTRYSPLHTFEKTHEQYCQVIDSMFDKLDAGFLGPWYRHPRLEKDGSIKGEMESRYRADLPA